MNTGTAKNPDRVVFDTNILISALVYGGNPQEALRLALTKQIQAIISPILQAELIDIITKKFPLSLTEMYLLKEEIERSFIIVNPQMDLDVVRDNDDNRVLEAAVEGECDFVITGDKDLLDLGQFENIKIITSTQFLEIFNER